MGSINELYLKFPVTWRNKLIDEEISFPNGTMFDYEKIQTYRVIEREPEDNHEVDRDDFRSYFELKKTPKSPRGINLETLMKKPNYYGVSSFLKKEVAEQKMHFPNPHKKIAIGFVQSEGGPQYTEEHHVCWWLYEDADVSGYKII